MNVLRGGFFLTFSMTLLGCQILNGYVYKAKHYRFGTVAEQDVSRPVDVTVKNLKIILTERDMSVSRVENDGETARVWAKKDGIDFIFDITSAGEESCRVHLELSQAGNDQLAFSVLRELSSMI